MKVPATYISFQKSGIVRPMLCSRIEQQIDEAVVRCDNMNEEATLLDENLRVLARVKYTPGALNNYVVVKVPQPELVS